MHLLYVLFLGIFTAVSSISFTTPPEAGAVGDYSQNTIYIEGSTLNIQWTLDPADDEKTISMTLSQDLPGDLFEYVLTNVNDTPTSFSWPVQTKKDLTKTNAFFFQIFEDGATSEAATSHYFNITAKNVVPATTSSTSTSSTSSTSTSASSTSSTPSSAKTSSTSSASGSAPVPSGASSGLSIGAKAGLGVGIAAVVILGLLGAFAIWLKYSKRKKEDAPITPMQYGAPAADVRYHDYYAPKSQGGDVTGPTMAKYELQSQGGGGPTMGKVELPANT